MILPEPIAVRDEYLKWVLDTCLLSRTDRRNMYNRRRQFFLYGTGHDQDVLYNRLSWCAPAIDDGYISTPPY